MWEYDDVVSSVFLDSNPLLVVHYLLKWDLYIGLGHIEGPTLRTKISKSSTSVKLLSL